MKKMKSNRFADTNLMNLARVIIFLLIISICHSSEAIPLVYQLGVGNTYTFEITSRITSEFNVYENKYVASNAATGTISVKVLEAREGVFVLDLWEGENHCRRFLKPDGSIVAWPGEDAYRLPFFWNFPAGDWQTGQKHRITANLPSSRQAAPAIWELTMRELDPSSRRVRIELSGTISLPSDRLIQRSIEAKGVIFFNLNQGCLDQGEWTLNYQLSYANKAVAVIRDLWKIKETRIIGFRLKGVTND